jgi:hypothetical protein
MEKKFEREIKWIFDSENNTHECWVDDTMLCDIEILEDHVTIYEMRKKYGHFINKPTLEEAKEYCINVLLPITKIEP